MSFGAVVRVANTAIAGAALRPAPCALRPAPVRALLAALGRAPTLAAAAPGRAPQWTLGAHRCVVL